MTSLTELGVPTAPPYRVDWDAIDVRHAFVRAMKDVPQDPVHHAEGDVWIHTRMVLEALVALPAFQALDAEEQAIVFAAALLHDVGKPASTRVGDDGRVTSKGHSTKGEKIARRILWQRDVPFATRESVAALVRHHQAPFWLLERDDPRGLLARISQTARCDLLALLAEADARGRHCADQTRLLDNIALFRELAAELGCLDAPFAFPSDHARFLWFAGRQRDPTHRPYEAFKSEVILMSGFPGAGKDRWIADQLPALAQTSGRTWEVVSLDQLREEQAVDPEDDQGAIVQAAREQARAYLRAGRSFVWNATNVSRRVRAICLRLFADYAARVRIVYVEVPEPDLAAQNKRRPRPVPSHVLEALLDRWDPPDRTEAHEVTYVVGRASR